MAKMMSDTPAGYLNVRDAAERIGVHAKTLTRRCEAGKVPGAERQQYKGLNGWRWLVPIRWANAEARRVGGVSRET